LWRTLEWRASGGGEGGQLHDIKELLSRVFVVQWGGFLKEVHERDLRHTKRGYGRNGGKGRRKASCDREEQPFPEKLELSGAKDISRRGAKAYPIRDRRGSSAEKLVCFFWVGGRNSTYRTVT